MTVYVDNARLPFKNWRMYPRDVAEFIAGGVPFREKRDT